MSYDVFFSSGHIVLEILGDSDSSVAFVDCEEVLGWIVTSDGVN